MPSSSPRYSNVFSITSILRRAPATLKAAAYATSLCMVLPYSNAEAKGRDDELFGAAKLAQPAVVQTLKDLVMIESGSGDAEGLARMADYTETRLKQIGATTDRLPTSNSKGTMVRGVLKGSGTAKILLIGHMDTVYEKGVLQSQPIREDGNRLYGPGIADDKGGLAVILHSLALLQARKFHDYGQITVLMNQDEEVGSTGSGATIARIAAESDFVFSCEPSPAKAVAKAEGLLLAAAGTATVELDVKGLASHAGAAPERGRNALLELAYQLTQTKDVAAGIPGAQLNWTIAQAGRVPNQIPDKASATADVRLTSLGAEEKLREALQQKVASGHLVPETTNTVTLKVGRPPFVATTASRNFGAHAQAIYAELDGRPLILIPSTGGATDAGFANKSGKAVVLESFGLSGFGYHARDEYIELDSIVPRLYLMTRLIEDISHGNVN